MYCSALLSFLVSLCFGAWAFWSVKGKGWRFTSHFKVVVLVIAFSVSFSFGGRQVVSQYRKEGQLTEPMLVVEEIRQVSRGPLWDNSYLQDDEVVVITKGKHNVPHDSENKRAIVAFWRLTNSFETNWHIGKRRVEGDWELAKLDLDNTNLNQPWEFVIGGIKCQKSYSSSIVIVLLAMPDSMIDQRKREWIHDNLGWGFKSLPSGSEIFSSQVSSVETKTVR